MTSFNEKLAKAIIRIQSTVAKVGPTRCFIGHSGGKDSAVVKHLTHLVNPSISMIHNPKVEGMNAVHPDTAYHLYSIAAKETMVFVPGIKMKDYLDKREIKLQIDGTRADENERSDRSSDLVVNGKSINRSMMTEYNANGLWGIPMLYPIYDWTADEVWDYIEAEQIPISIEYQKIGDQYALSRNINWAT